MTDIKLTGDFKGVPNQKAFRINGKIISHYNLMDNLKLLFKF